MPELLNILTIRTGHFRFESGHHGNLWLDLDSLFLSPSRIRPFALELAARVRTHEVNAVCGPLVGGALLAQMVASELNVEFFYSERIVKPAGHAGSEIEYAIPQALRPLAEGKRFAIIDDAINAGSAVRATFSELLDCNAKPIALAALLTLGSSAAQLAAESGMSLETIERLVNHLWVPENCPMCLNGIQLDDLVS